ncbi:hypothetical protein [uncultured Zobellia sp.]|uniref:hypothetical protein n=1 Tax=uncultured Zobellia sp. TaxID=255433 RepID=UPI002596F31F|nr:hypothetical protein [uncultured Zobellia sp.]
MQSLLEKQKIGLKEISNLEIKTQFHKIDVFVSFIMNNKTYGVIIEDKVHTINHSNQLERYKIKIKELNSAIILTPIYFKTGYQVNLASIKENKYNYYTVKDLLKVLTQAKVSQVNNNVLTQYHSYILGKEKEFDKAEKDANAYLTAPLGEWNWWTCARFFHEFKEYFTAGWGSVGNNREPLLALWCEGTTLIIKDVDTGSELKFHLYLDVIYSGEGLKMNFRIGNLKAYPQSNNRNRNKLYKQFSRELNENKVVHRKPNFRKSKSTLCLAQITEMDKTIKYLDLVKIIEHYKNIAHQFAKNYTDA